MYVLMYLQMYVLMYLQMYVLMYLQMYVGTYVPTNVCRYLCTYICKYLCIYIPMYVLILMIRDYLKHWPSFFDWRLKGVFPEVEKVSLKNLHMYICEWIYVHGDAVSLSANNAFLSNWCFNWMNFLFLGFPVIGPIIETISEKVIHLCYKSLPMYFTLKLPRKQRSVFKGR
jgi:hypothetical protein